MFLAKHGVLGVVVTSTGTLCHACVLCSSTSVGRQSLRDPVQIACHFTVHWEHAVHCALHYRSKNTCWRCHPALDSTQFIHDLSVRFYFMLMKKKGKKKKNCCKENVGKLTVLPTHADVISSFARVGFPPCLCHYSRRVFSALYITDRSTFFFFSSFNSRPEDKPQRSLYRCWINQLLSWYFSFFSLFILTISTHQKHQTHKYTQQQQRRDISSRQSPEFSSSRGYLYSLFQLRLH